MHAWVEGVTSQAHGAVKKVSIAPHGRAQWHSDSFNDPQQSWMSTPLSVMLRRSLAVMMLMLFAPRMLCCPLSVHSPVGIILSHWERLDFPHASNTADMRCPPVHPPTQASSSATGGAWTSPTPRTRSTMRTTTARMCSTSGSPAAGWRTPRRRTPASTPTR